jgi:hypothetical protein
VEDNTIMVNGERMLPAHCNATQVEVVRCMRAHKDLCQLRTAAARAAEPATCFVKRVRVQLVLLYNACREVAAAELVHNVEAMVSDWLAGWLPGWLAAWLPGCLARCLAAWLVGWLISWLSGGDAGARIRHV